MSNWTKLERLLSLIVGIVYAAFIVAQAVTGSKTAAEATMRSCEWCLIIFIPVAMIWFTEQIGAATGFIGHGYVNAETPPVLVAIAGWFFLVGLSVVAYWLR